MRFTRLKFTFKLRTLLRDNGQDVVEYALVIGLLVLAATAAFKSFAGQLSDAFSNIGTAISTRVG